MTGPPAPLDQTAPGAGPAPGSVILGPFPRMMGKARPGVVILVSGGVVAAPITSARQGAATRIPLTNECGSGLSRPSWALPGMVALLPLSQIGTAFGVVSAEFLALLEAEIARIHGPNWRRADPAVTKPALRARLLHPRRRNRK